MDLHPTHGGVAILPYPGDKLGLDGPFSLSKKQTFKKKKKNSVLEPSGPPSKSLSLPVTLT